MYNYLQITEKNFEEAERALRHALQERGFGILTEIDVQATMKKKLGIDVESYKILGACNPKYAHQALSEEPNIGVLLPCNCIIRKENEKVLISCVLPTVQLGKVDNPKLAKIADQVEELLKQAIDEVHHL